MLQKLEYLEKFEMLDKLEYFERFGHLDNLETLLKELEKSSFEKLKKMPVSLHEKQPSQRDRLHKSSETMLGRRFIVNIFTGGGFGPVATDGYGVSYMLVGGSDFFFHVSSRRCSPYTVSDSCGILISPFGGLLICCFALYSLSCSWIRRCSSAHPTIYAIL